MSDDDFNTRSERAERVSASSLGGEPQFGPRYKVLAKLGEGGMGEVFRAYDAELRGEVALKVVRADKDDAEASLTRFRREIALARKVTSPNVLRVYDLEDHDGLRFLSMEFVEGDDLAAVMRKGRLSIERALAIFKQVCTGLAAAHEQGVVHRDLKPQNVLVDHHDHVKVADFGLARSIGDSGMTATGAVLGSPAYMSPEQVKGEATDERSDIYSLGIILYQMISGQTPFKADTPHAVMEMRLHKPPTPLHELEPMTPRAVDAVAAKCLAVNPAARYASVRELLEALDAPPPVAKPKRTWIVPTALIVAGALVGTVIFVTRGSNAPPVPTASVAAAQRPALPKLPPPAQGNPAIVLVKGENRTHDPALDSSLAFIVRNELRYSALLDPYSGVQAQSLVDEQSVGSAIDDPIGRQLSEFDHCRVYIVRIVATTRGSGYAIALTADDSADGTILLHRELTIERRDDIVAAVVGWAHQLRRTVGEDLPPDESARTKPMSTNLDAINTLAVADGLQRTQDDAGASRQLLRALALDPSLISAHEKLSLCYYNLGRFTEAGEQERIVLEQIDQLSEHDRLKFLADYHSITTGEYDRSIAAFLELLKKWPHDPGAENNLGSVYAQTHNIPKAIEIGLHAFASHPRNGQGLLNLALYEVFADDLDAASRELDKYADTFSHTPGTLYEYRTMISVLRGQVTEALANAAKIAAVAPSRAVMTEADLSLMQSKLADAVAMLEKAIASELDQDARESEQVLLAEAYLRQGNKKAALATAQKISKELTRQFLAALVELAAGDRAAPAATADRLAREAPPMPRSLSKLLSAELARASGKLDNALVAYRAAIALDDAWYSHFFLARALFDAKRYAEAQTELDICRRRRGEAVTMFDDDLTTLRMLPPVTYWLARTQEALGKPEAKATYALFLADQSIADRDPLVVDATRRAAALAAKH